MRIHAKVCSHQTHMSEPSLHCEKDDCNNHLRIYLWKGAIDTNKMPPKIGKGTAPYAKQRVTNANTYTQICYIRRIGYDILPE